MTSSKSLVLALVLAAAAVDMASARVVMGVADGETKQKAYAVDATGGPGHCYVEMKAGTNQVDFYYTFECDGTGGTITWKKYTACGCDSGTEFFTQNIMSGSNYASHSWTCDEGKTAADVVDQITYTDSACTGDAGDACNFNQVPIGVCLIGNYVGAGADSGYSKAEFTNTATRPYSFTWKKYTDADCTAEDSNPLLLSADYTDVMPPANNECSQNQNVQCNNGNQYTGGELWSTATNSQCSAGFVLYSSSASSSASSLVASSLAALLAVAAAPLFL